MKPKNGRATIRNLSSSVLGKPLKVHLPQLEKTFKCRYKEFETIKKRRTLYEKLKNGLDSDKQKLKGNETKQT